MSNLNDTVVVKQQYATAKNLNTRISIHDKYSTNKMGFGNWIVSNYRLEKGMSVLELGCGTGDMWRNRENLISTCNKLILSDFSDGMVATAKDNIGNYDNLEYRVMDIQDIPYENETFDVVIANMMLYHVPDIEKGLSEVRRVLKRGGCFYCATYGEHGIIEYLSKIEKLEYIDSLAITNVEDMVEYIYSLSSMTSLSLVPKHEIKDILMNHTANGILNVPKEYGMFIAS